MRFHRSSISPTIVLSGTSAFTRLLFVGQVTKARVCAPPDGFLDVRNAGKKDLIRFDFNIKFDIGKARRNPALSYAPTVCCIGANAVAVARRVMSRAITDFMMYIYLFTIDVVIYEGMETAGVVCSV